MKFKFKYFLKFYTIVLAVFVIPLTSHSYVTRDVLGSTEINGVDYEVVQRSDTIGPSLDKIEPDSEDGSDDDEPDVSITPTPGPTPDRFTLQANKSTIYPGQPVTLTYTTSGPNNPSDSPAYNRGGVHECSKWSRPSVFSGWSSGSEYFEPERKQVTTHTTNTLGTSTFYMSCKLVTSWGSPNDNGNYTSPIIQRVNRTALVTVIPRPLTCALNATDTDINEGQSTTLSWSASSTVGEATITNTTDTTTFTITNPKGNGTRVVTPTRTTRYTMTVKGANNTEYKCNRLVKVTQTPEATLSAGNCTIPTGSSTCQAPVTWNIKYAADPIVINRTRNIIYTQSYATSTNVLKRITNGPNLIQARNGTKVLASTTAIGKCSTDATWNPQAANGVGRCIADKDPVLILKGTSCLIKEGGRSCPSTITWLVTNPETPKLYKHGTPTSLIATTPSGTRPVTLTPVASTFSLRDTGSMTLLSLTAKCAPPTTWNGSICAASDSGLEVTNCVIYKNKSTCNALMSWDFKNLKGKARVINTTANRPYTVSKLKLDDAYQTINHGPNTITAYDGQVALDTRIANGTCARGLDWKGGKCVSKPPCVGPSCPPPPPPCDITLDPTCDPTTNQPDITLTLDTEVVRSGDPTVLNWTITNLTTYTCSLTGPGIEEVTITRPNLTGKITTAPIINQSVFTLTCDNGSDTVTENVTVEVVPKVQEV